LGFDTQAVGLGWFVPAFQAEERETGYAQVILVTAHPVYHLG
jgi:hypothetical protein